jgi:hypothetical protein
MVRLKNKTEQIKGNNLLENNGCSEDIIISLIGMGKFDLARNVVKR